MGNTLKFFLNAIKAIVFSPFYLLYFFAFFSISLFNHLIGEIKVIFTGFKYGSKNENKYNNELKTIVRRINSGGDK